MQKVADARFASVAALLLVFMGVLAGGAARRESVTVDELAHTAAGVSYWQKLDLRMNEEHPPLAKLLAAIPLVLRGARADYSSISWTWSGGPFNQYLGEWVFGDWFLMHWNDPYSTVFWSRVPMLLLTLLLGAVLYVFGSKLGASNWAGLLCLTAYVTTPTFLAFGPLVITDIAITLFWLLTIWQLPQMWRSPSRKQVVSFGLALAAALLSKFSSGLLFFVFPAVALSLRLRPLPEQPIDKLERKRWRRRAWRNIFKGTLWAALFVYLVYLVFSWNQPTDVFDLVPHFPKSALLRRLLWPVAVYLRGLIGFAMSAGTRPTFILGHSYPHGVWFYFPVLFFLKSQMAFLLLLLIAAVTAVVVKRKSTGRAAIIPSELDLNWRCIWVSLIVYAAACFLNRLDISIRHFSIALALIILLLAPLPRMLSSLRAANPGGAQVGKWATIALAAVLLFVAVRVYPHYFPCFNSLSLGRPGYALVNDSNLDWNQGLLEAEEFFQQQGVKKVLFDEYGFSDAGPYIPGSEQWNCQQPRPSDAGAWALVSANMIEDGHNCVWLLQYPHRELVAGGMYAFQLPQQIPAAGESGGPPLPKDYHYFGGLTMLGEDPREIFWACIRDPRQLQPTLERFMTAAQNYKKKN